MDVCFSSFCDICVSTSKLNFDHLIDYIRFFHDNLEVDPNQNVLRLVDVVDYSDAVTVQSFFIIVNISF